MRKSLVIIMMVLGLAACENKPPELLVSEEELVPILADVHIAEAAMQHLRGELKDSMADVYYQELYEIHNVSKEDFDQTMELLREDPVRMERIYNNVIELISEIEAENKK